MYTSSNSPFASTATVWTDDRIAVWSNVSWGAIILGAIIALAVQSLLALLGAGIGFSVTDPTLVTPERMSRSALGVGLWWIVSSVISVYIGAWVAAEITTPGTERAGALQGIAVWAVATLAGVVLAGTMASGIASHSFTLTSATGMDSVGTMTRGVDASGKVVVPTPADEQVRAREAAKAAARTAFVMFVAGGLGLIAGAFGGTHNRRHRVGLYEQHVKLQASRQAT